MLQSAEYNRFVTDFACKFYEEHKLLFKENFKEYCRIYKIEKEIARIEFEYGLEKRLA